MSGGLLAALAFAALLALVFLRVPIALAMLISGLGGTYLLTGRIAPLAAQMKALPFDTFANYSLSIVPLFLLMGQFASRGGMSAALFRAANAWLGHRRGGVAMAAVGACAGFGAICGSSLATAATMGKVALPELKRFGYSGALATGSLAAGGTLGILIPPSVILVIYAILTSQNIAKLFLAALVPGLLAAVGYMLAIAVYVRFRPAEAGRSERAGGRERVAALAEIWPVLLVFLSVIGGIYLGIFTPTEGAAVGAAGTGLIAALGRMGWRSFMEALLETATATGMIFFIVLGAAVFNTFLAQTQIVNSAVVWIEAAGPSPWLVLAGVLALYLLLGCIMDSLSMILLTVPILFPVMAGLDFGLPPEEFAIWFGVLVLIVVEVGLITPPVGLNLFVINGMAGGVPLSATFRGVLPFIASDVLRVALLAAFPVLSLGLVRLLW